MRRLVNAVTGVIVNVDDETASHLGADWKAPDAAPETDADEAQESATPDESQDAGEATDAAPVKRGRASKSE